MRKAALCLLFVALVTASCSSNRGDDSSNASGVSGDATGSKSQLEAKASAGDWGTLKDVCGPNEGGGEVPTDDAQGVSADSITLGTVADPGFVATPGLNQEIFDAGEAFVAWCNAAGGINGKQLKLNLHDAKITEYQPVIEQSCKTDFALVGGGAVQDNLWPTVGAACGLVDVAGFSVTPEKAGPEGRKPSESRSVQAVPNASDTYPVGGIKIVERDFPGSGDRVGQVFADYQTLKAQAAKEKAGFESIGFTIAHSGTYNVLGEANWKPFATAIQADKVTFLKFVGQGTNAGLLEQAMAQVGYVPEVRYYETNFYDQAFLDAGGEAVNGAFIGSLFIPLEEASTHPATQQYIDVVKKQGGKIALLGMQSTSAWLMFATMAKQCDIENNLTRTCMLDKADHLTEWDGGGLHAPGNPSANEPPKCGMVIQVQDQKFVRYAPTDKDFECSDDFIATNLKF